MTTTTAPLAPGRAVPYAVALGMSDTVGKLIRVSGRSVPGDVFASVALPVHRTPGAWVRADRVPVACGTRCALYACKRGAVVIFAYLHEHDRELPPLDQRRGDMEAPDGPPRPQGTRVLSWGRRQYSWSTARDVSPIVGKPDSERVPDTEDEGLQLVQMLDHSHAAPSEVPGEDRERYGLASGVKATYSRVMVTKDLHTPKAERGRTRKAHAPIFDPLPPRS